MSLEQINKTLFQKLHILYVEDEQNTREEIALFLKMTVGRVTVAENGQEGLDAFRREKIDMVITDIQMPVMNGLDMVRAIREIDKDVPIAVTTAFSDTDFLMRAIESGVDKYIIKPIDMMEMALVIQKCTNYNYMVQKLEAYDDYSRFLLQEGSPFMMIVHNRKYEYAHEELQKLMHIRSGTKIENAPFTFVENRDISEISQQDWIEYVRKHEDVVFLVTFQNATVQYRLQCKHFENLDKTVFLFHLDKPERSLEEYTTAITA